jgi:hypothetical protein
VSEERIAFLSLGGVFLEKNNPPVTEIFITRTEVVLFPLHVLKLPALGCKAMEKRVCPLSIKEKPKESDFCLVVTAQDRGFTVPV